MFSVQYPHIGNILSNGDLENKVLDICERFAVMMRELPRLGQIPVTDRFITKIKPALSEAVGTKESSLILEGTRWEQKTVTDVWNTITNLPHRIDNPEKKLKLENLGFQILMMYLLPNKN